MKVKSPIFRPVGLVQKLSFIECAAHEIVNNRLHRVGQKLDTHGCFWTILQKLLQDLDLYEVMLGIVMDFAHKDQISGPKPADKFLEVDGPAGLEIKDLAGLDRGGGALD